MNFNDLNSVPVTVHVTKK